MSYAIVGYLKAGHAGSECFIFENAATPELAEALAKPAAQMQVHAGDKPKAGVYLVRDRATEQSNMFCSRAGELGYLAFPLATSAFDRERRDNDNQPFLPLVFADGKIFAVLGARKISILSLVGDPETSSAFKKQIVGFAITDTDGCAVYIKEQALTEDVAYALVLHHRDQLKIHGKNNLPFIVGIRDVNSKGVDPRVASALDVFGIGVHTITQEDFDVQIMREGAVLRYIPLRVGENNRLEMSFDGESFRPFGVPSVVRPWRFNGGRHEGGARPS